MLCQTQFFLEISNWQFLRLVELLPTENYYWHPQIFVSLHPFLRPISFYEIAYYQKKLIAI